MCVGPCVRLRRFCAWTVGHWCRCRNVACRLRWVVCKSAAIQICNLDRETVSTSNVHVDDRRLVVYVPTAKAEMYCTRTATLARTRTHRDDHPSGDKTQDSPETRDSTSSQQTETFFFLFSLWALITKNRCSGPSLYDIPEMAGSQPKPRPTSGTDMKLKRSVYEMINCKLCWKNVRSKLLFHFILSRCDLDAPTHPPKKTPARAHVNRT